MINEITNSYRNVVKATAIFGGVQVLNIIIGIIRSKFVAVMLGPEGMGIAGLITSTTGIIASLTNFGLGTSAVKDISSANSTGNQERIALTVVAFKKIVWLTGIIGMLIVAIGAKYLSLVTFGNEIYYLGFVIISITLLINQLSSAQYVILQGLRKLKYLAKANVFGGFVGLVISFPIYYFYGNEGIIPVICISSLISLIFGYYYSNKIEIKKIKINLKQSLIVSKDMLKMGFLISLSSLISASAAYILRIYISNFGGVIDVGLFSAGFAILNTYVGVIFTAMGADFYPRLSAVSHSNEQCNKVINQQAEIAILILGPIIITFIVFINWVVIFFYSSKFLPIKDMMLFAVLGIFFKAASWSVGFYFLSKADSKLFFLNDLVSYIYFLILNIVGYKIWGLTGLGISFLVSYFLHLIQVIIATKINYNFSFNKDFFKIFLIQSVIAILTLTIVKLTNEPFSYLIGSIFIILSLMYSYYELDKRIGIKSYLKNAIKRG